MLKLPLLPSQASNRTAFKFTQEPAARLASVLSARVRASATPETQPDTVAHKINGSMPIPALLRRSRFLFLATTPD
jgi:hypothetical protein